MHASRRADKTRPRSSPLICYPSPSTAASARIASQGTPRIRHIHQRLKLVQSALIPLARASRGSAVRLILREMRLADVGIGPSGADRRTEEG